LEPSHTASPEYWRKRAEGLRTLAMETHNGSAKETVLRIAREYDDLAQKAEASTSDLAGQK
jgi:hypothetical protein